MPRTLQSLELAAPSPALAPPRVESQPQSSRRQLWLAVCLPSLALECLAVARSSRPVVVVEAERGELRVVAANREAVKAGIGASARLSTAIALAARLQVFERAPQLERTCLESFARWSQTLTSLVTLEPPEGVLLEVSGSLKLFGTLDVIKAKLRTELERRALHFRCCVAPTPTAALWLARAASADVSGWHELSGRVGALSLGVTHWPQSVQTLLRDVGVRTLGDCARLPREGFARRVGHGYLRELDRAYGRSVDLRAEYAAPHAWSSRIELDEESVDSGLLLQAIELLLDELTAELRRRQAQVAAVQIAFEHLHRPPTVERFDLLEPVHERERLLHLVEDRLERSFLPLPAIALRMSSGVLLPLSRREADLFERRPLEERVRTLLERLRGRFGLEAVYGLRALAEHRPEKSWKKDVEIESKHDLSAALQRQMRPLWLLEQPVPLSPQTGRASLTPGSGPERIESGWWDEQDVARDYYLATNARGQKLWVFRDRRTRTWFVHGLFG